MDFAQEVSRPENHCYLWNIVARSVKFTRTFCESSRIFEALEAFNWPVSVIVTSHMVIDRHAALLADLFVGFIPLKWQCLIDRLSV